MAEVALVTPGEPEPQARDLEGRAMRWLEAGRRVLQGRAGVLWRFSWFALRRFWNDRCPQSAAALTYTSLLALVPLTTIMVMLLSAFPAFDEVRQTAQNLVINNLMPDAVDPVAEYMQGFADNAGRLTSVGIVGLMVTSVLLLATIEGAFNAIWRVREARSLLIRLLAFWAILTLTPLLFAASLSVTTQLFSQADLARALPGVDWVGILPALFESLAFALLYWIIPNRAVEVRDALLGGVVAAVLFELSKSLFGLYLTAFPVYETVYGALATIPIFLLWLYVAWSIVLLGAEVAAALPDYRADRLIGGWHRLSHAQRLILAVGVLATLAASARDGKGLRRRHLLRRLPVGAPVLDGMLTELRAIRYVVRAANERFVICRDLSTVTVRDLALALDTGLVGGARDVPGAAGPWFDRLGVLVERLDDAITSILDLPLDDLVAPAEPESDAPASDRDNTVSLALAGRREPASTETGERA